MKKVFVLLTLFLFLLSSQDAHTQPFKDFDVVASDFDVNGFPLNPKWGKQIEEHTIPNPAESCPVHSDHANDWTASPEYPNCTTFPVSFNGRHICGPHVNFMPVTYESIVTFEDHSSSFLDDDYTLNVRRDDAALYTTRRSEIHIEFNSEETVDNWDDTHTWWDDFHHNWVDHGQAKAHERIDGSSVSVIGELNLDAGHDGFTELHPVYAMFVQLNERTCGSSWCPEINDPFASSWAFFVRNWGDQGYCGSQDRGLYTSEWKIKIFIPNQIALISDNIWEGAQKDDQLSPMSVSAQRYNKGILLTFTLLPPEKQSWFVGDLQFRGRPRIIEVVTPQAPAAGRNQNESNDDDDVTPELKALIARIDQLPEDAKKEFYAQLKNLNPKTKSFPVKAKFINPATVIGNRNLVRASNVATAKLNQQTKIEFATKYLAAEEKVK